MDSGLKRLQPCETRRLLEQQRQEHALRQSQQQRPGQQEQQPRLSCRCRVASTGTRQDLYHHGGTECPIPVPARYPAPGLKDYPGRTCSGPRRLVGPKRIRRPSGFFVRSMVCKPKWQLDVNIKTGALMRTISFDIPDENPLMLKLSPQALVDEVRIAAAVKLYELQRLSSGAAAGLAGVPKVVFLSKLADYEVDTFKMTEEEMCEEIRLDGNHL